MQQQKQQMQQQKQQMQQQKQQMELLRQQAAEEKQRATEEKARTDALPRAEEERTCSRRKGASPKAAGVDSVSDHGGKDYGYYSVVHAQLLAI